MTIAHDPKPALPKPRRTLRDFGLACPACQNADKLTIEITCEAVLTINGSEALGEHFWDRDSHCHCNACSHEGTVADFDIENSQVRP